MIDPKQRHWSSAREWLTWKVYGHGVLSGAEELLSMTEEEILETYHSLMETDGYFEKEEKEEATDESGDKCESCGANKAVWVSENWRGCDANGECGTVWRGGTAIRSANCIRRTEERLEDEIAVLRRALVYSVTTTLLADAIFLEPGEAEEEAEGYIEDARQELEQERKDKEVKE